MVVIVDLLDDFSCSWLRIFLNYSSEGLIVDEVTYPEQKGIFGDKIPQLRKLSAFPDT